MKTGPELLQDKFGRDLVWLWTHCRAIGMTKEAQKSDETPCDVTRDICLFTIELKEKADKVAEAKKILLDLRRKQRELPQSFHTSPSVAVALSMLLDLLEDPQERELRHAIERMDRGD